MIVMRIFLALFFGVLLGSCATSPIHDIEYDFDSKANFANLRTYHWPPPDEKAGIDSLDLNRVRKAVNAGLQAKGLRMTSDNPDFLISARLASEDRINVKNWGYRRNYRGTDRVVTYQYEEGSLILEFVDSKSKNLIWLGAAKANIYSVLTPEERDRLINDAVRRILVNFPPPPSK